MGGSDPQEYQYDEGGGEFPPYKEDFFQRIVNVSWQKQIYAVDAQFNILGSFFLVLDGQVSATGGPTKPVPIQNEVLLALDGTENDIRLSGTYTDKNGNAIGDWSYHQSADIFGSASILWTDYMTFASEQAALKWQPFGGATSLTIAMTFDAVNTLSSFANSSASPVIAASISRSGPKGFSTVRDQQEMQANWGTNPGSVYDGNGIKIGTLPAGITSVTFIGTVDMVKGKVTACSINGVSLPL